MLLAVNRENAVKCHLRFTLILELAVHSIRLEDDLGILIGLQNLTRHPMIAPFGAGIAAACVHHQFAFGAPACRVDAQRAAFQREAAMHGVQRAIHQYSTVVCAGVNS